MMEFTESSDKISLADIQTIEQELGVRFPNAFIDLYLEHNGGCPVRNLYPWKTGGRTEINTFVSIKHAGFISLEETYKDLVVIEKYLPDGIVVFAVDLGGNYFCISCREQDYETIYYQNNDHYILGDRESALTFLENNFTAFLDSLVSSIE